MAAIILEGTPDDRLPKQFGAGRWLCECCASRENVMYRNTSWYGVSLGDVVLCRKCRRTLPPTVIGFCVAYLLRYGKAHPAIERLHAMGEHLLLEKVNGPKPAQKAAPRVLTA